MPYYFRADPSIRNSNKLKGYEESHARSIAPQIASLLHTTINYYWTRRDTFGFIFTDFEYTQQGHQRLIGKGELDLFRRLKDDFYCVVLSNSLGRNYEVFELGRRKCIRINLDYFKDFLAVVRDSSKTVRLFLYRFDKQDDEELIRRWLKNYDGFDEVQKEAATDPDWMRGTIEKYNIQDVQSLEALITLASAIQSKAFSKLEPWEEKLIEFQKLVDEDALESRLHDFLFNNLWMIDIQYQFYEKKLRKQTLEVGEPDIALYQDALGIERVALIELKRAEKNNVSTSYRGESKPVIMAEFGRALSQTIHYIEDLKGKGRMVEGILIIGRKRDMKDWFVETFNSYLHGVRVLTYDDIIQRAKNTITTLRDLEADSIQNVPPELANQTLQPSSMLSEGEDDSSTQISPSDSLDSRVAENTAPDDTNQA